ncbi:MAG: trigger factor [Dehalococcoidia bacterium]|nr:MAG: trigger factor [Dehalococcoidia bacterium]
MKVTNEKTENRQAFLTVAIEPAEMEKSLEEAYQRLVKRANIPGFRKGKAPRDVIERYLGRDSLLEDALNKLVPEACEQAIKEQAIEAIAHPQVEITQTEPLIFKATVPLTPQIELGDYHQVRLEPEPVSVDEAKVDQVLEQLRHQQAVWEPVERPLDFSDLVILDVESQVEDKPFINQKGVQYQVRRDSSAPAPGFAEQLLGMKKGEAKEFSLGFPSDYPRAELAGKEAHFKVKIGEIKQEKLPELNDKLAREVDPKFKTLASLRKQASADLQRNAERKARLDFEDRVIEAVTDTAQVEFPPILVELEIDQLIAQQLRSWQMDWEALGEYLTRINKTEEELREELRPLATKRVRRSLALGKIAIAEKIKVTDAEIDAEIKNMLKGDIKDHDRLEKQLNTPQSRESIGQVLFTRKTIRRLVAIAESKADSKVKEAKND